MGYYHLGEQLINGPPAKWPAKLLATKYLMWFSANKWYPHISFWGIENSQNFKSGSLRNEPGSSLEPTKLNL